MSKNEIAHERKHQIVKATVDCISKFGYHNFSMQDVARTAGVSKGIIHYYFLNKDELMLSVLEQVSSNIEEVLSSDLKNAPSPIEKLKIFIRVCCNVVKDTKEYYQVSMDFWTQINQKEAVKKIISEHYEQFRSAIAAIITSGINSNEFRSVNPIDYATYIIAVVDGISLQWLFAPDAFDHSSMVNFVVDEISRGIKK